MEEREVVRWKGDWDITAIMTDTVFWFRIFGKIDGFHCGECLEVMVDGKWVATRMEMSAGREWYLVGTGYKGDLEYIMARI